MREPGLRRLARLAFAARPRRVRGRRRASPDRPARAGESPPAGAAGLRHRLAALGRQRRARLHRRRHGPPDLRRGLRRDDPARHALAVGLAHRAQPAGLRDRPLPLHGVRRARSRGRLRRHSRRPADARDRVAAREPAPAAPRPHRLPPHPPDGRAATRDDLTDVEQTLDLWNGVLRSRFRIEGEPVAVETLCHPAPRPRRGARRLAARRARADRRPPPLPLRHGSGHRRGLDPSGGARDEDRPADADERRSRPASRRRPLSRPARLGPGGRVRRGRRSTRSSSRRATATSPSRR